MDSRRSPQRIRGGHLLHQRAHGRVGAGTARAGPSRAVRPAAAEPVAMPLQHRVGLNDHQRRAPLPPPGTDHAFSERVLPGRARRRQHILDSHRLRGTPKVRSVDRVAIPYQESRGGVPRPRLAELLRGPRRGRMLRDVEVNDAPAVVGQQHEGKQHTEGGGGNGEEVTRGEWRDVSGEEGSPRLRRGPPAMACEVLRHGRLGDLLAKLPQLAVDARRTPARVGRSQLADQGAEVRIDGRPSGTSGS